MTAGTSLQLGSLQLILSSDGDPIYCVCRQPDDLQVRDRGLLMTSASFT